MKKCSKCKKNKENSDFNKNKSSKDGLCTLCKICHRENSKKHQKTETGRLKHNKKSREWEIRNKEKKLAHGAVARAIKKGVIKKEPCIKCGSENTEAHHENYKNKLGIVWVCKEHHEQIHHK